MTRSPVRRRWSAGLTLMEVLIAVSLVSLLSLGMLFAIRIGLNAMVKTDKRLMGNRRVLGAQRILEQQLLGIMPVKAGCRAAPNRPPSPIAFFQGEPQSMRFVSTYSIQEAARGYPRILEFQVIPGEEFHGVRLVVNEFIYSGPASTGLTCLGLAPDPTLGVAVPLFRPIETGPQSFVLADRLAYCRFLFLEPAPPPLLARWVARWVRPQLPKAIRLEMGPIEPDAARLQPLTITMPVHVNREVMTDYAR